MLWPLLVTATILWAAYLRWKKRKIYRICEEISSGELKAWPLIGHTHLLRGSHEDIMLLFQKGGRVTNSQGGLATFWFVNQLYVVVTDPEVVDIALKSCLEKDNFTMKYMRTLLGNGSIFAPVNIWRPRRKILAPLFGMKNLNQFVEIFDKQSSIMAQLLKKVGREDFSIWSYATTNTFDAVCETTMGAQLQSQLNPNNAFLKSFERALQLLAKRICSPWYHPNVIYKNLAIYQEFQKCKDDLYRFIEELIEKKKIELENDKNDQSGKDRMRTFLEMMIMDSGYSDLELCEEIMVLMLAGTDTSAVGLGYTAVMLSRYQDIQDKVYTEIQEVFGNSERPVTSKDLTNLKYLDAVVKETLRLYPPVPVIVREVNNDIELPNGTTLVEGVSVFVDIWGVHRNQRYWGEDADVYRPERFLEGPLKHPAQFMPFSHTPRNCLGYNYAMMSMKTGLTNLLRNYKLLPPKTLDPARYQEPLRVEFDIMMKPVEDFILRLEPRKIN